jgi:hypothetical protein
LYEDSEGSSEGSEVGGRGLGADVFSANALDAIVGAEDYGDSDLHRSDFEGPFQKNGWYEGALDGTAAILSDDNFVDDLVPGLFRLDFCDFLSLLFPLLCPKLL